MTTQLPRNRKLTRSRPREGGPLSRTVGFGVRVKGFLRRVGHLVWPERFPVEVSQQALYRPRSFIWVWALSVFLASGAFITHLHVRFEIIEAGYGLSQAQAEQRQLRLAQRELRLELATIKEPGRIEQQAREMLGMDRPDHERIVRLGSGPRLARGR